MIEIYLMNENDAGRFRRPNDERDWFNGDTEDREDDELGFFGIVVRRKTTPSCPYDKDGNYVPRGLR